MPRHCVFCASPVPDSQSLEHPWRVNIDCPICGKFYLSEQIASRFPELLARSQMENPSPVQNHHLISAGIRERYEDTGERVPITDMTLLSPADHRPDPFDSVDRLLLNAQRRLPRVGTVVRFEPRFDYPMALARDESEFVGVLHFAQELDYGEVTGSSALRLKPAGWRRLAELRSGDVIPGSAFVAMGLTPELEAAFNEGIKPALEACGFHAIRVDLIQHNGKIDDRIVASIRRSALVVADFSGHRQNVYFEAGFALGIGRNVIWTCRSGDIENAHFDTRQYNHILWDSPADLQQRLRNRIEATIPNSIRRGGPISSAWHR